MITTELFVAKPVGHNLRLARLRSKQLSALTVSDAFDVDLVQLQPLFMDLSPVLCTMCWRESDPYIVLANAHKSVFLSISEKYVNFKYQNKLPSLKIAGFRDGTMIDLGGVGKRIKVFDEQGESIESHGLHGAVGITHKDSLGSSACTSCVYQVVNSLNDPTSFLIYISEEGYLIFDGIKLLPEVEEPVSCFHYNSHLDRLVVGYRSGWICILSGNQNFRRRKFLLIRYETASNLVFSKITKRIMAQDINENFHNEVLQNVKWLPRRNRIVSVHNTQKGELSFLTIFDTNLKTHQTSPLHHKIPAHIRKVILLPFTKTGPLLLLFPSKGPLTLAHLPSRDTHGKISFLPLPEHDFDPINTITDAFLLPTASEHLGTPQKLTVVYYKPYLLHRITFTCA